MASPTDDISDDEDFSARRPSPAYSDDEDEDEEERKNILEDVPETTIGENVIVTGSLIFKKLLRIDGKFEGKLESSGDLIIGRSGEVKGDILNMGELIIDGKVQGSLSADRIELRAKASVFGDVTCKHLTMDPSVVVVGAMNVNPFAPSYIDRDLKEIVPVEEPEPAPAEEAAAAPAAEAEAAAPAAASDDKKEEAPAAAPDGEEKKEDVAAAA